MTFANPNVLGKLKALTSVVLQRLVRRIHRCKWETTHTNQYGMATRQTCRCGVVREVWSDPKDAPLSFRFWWHYSDGRPNEKDERIFKHIDSPNDEVSHE